MTLAIVIIASVLIPLIVIFATVWRLLSRRAEAVRQRFPNAIAVVPGANFFGQESKGVLQTRGNGTLVLTDTELYFEKFIPRQEIHIPLSTIQRIETAKSHLGKTVFRPLLKVVYQNEAGQPDSIAWLVPDVEGLKQQLEALCDGHHDTL